MVRIPFFGNKKKQEEPVQKGAGITQTFIAAGVPVWRNLRSDLFQLRAYDENPIVQAVINIKADAFSNMQFKIKDLKTGDIFSLEEAENIKFNPDVKALVDLIKQPNPLQSTFEWLQQYKVNFEVFGNAYSYASVPVGFEKRFTFADINVMNNLAPYCVSPVLTGKWLDASTKEEIVSKYVLNSLTGKERSFDPNVVMHNNNTNIIFNEHFTEGRSELIALEKPISNIDAAYESRNVLIKNRGALGLITPDGRDANGTVPLTSAEKAEAQKDLESYGTMSGQWQHMLTNQPLKYQRMAMNMADLKLFEEIESDAIAIANAKGVPELLVKYYVQGGTFNNLDASEKRLYDSTIIPEAKVFLIGLNSFLKTEQKGLALIGSFDHINVLQVNKKDEATTSSINESKSNRAFKLGAITYGEYLQESGFPPNKDLENKRIWDLDDRQLSVLGITINNQNNGGT